MLLIFFFKLNKFKTTFYINFYDWTNKKILLIQILRTHIADDINHLGCFSFSIKENLKITRITERVSLHFKSFVVVQYFKVLVLVINVIIR